MTDLASADIRAALDDLWACIGHVEMTHLQPTTVATAKANHERLCHAEDSVADVLRSPDQAHALPIGSVIVMHHRNAEPDAAPGATWFRIQRGWINAYGSEVHRCDGSWPRIGWAGPANAATVVFRAGRP